MRDLGVDLIEIIDAIYVSHYHPSARFDLHSILNILRDFRLTEKETNKSGHKKILFGTKALIIERNEHPKVLIPSDYTVVEPEVTSPNRAWYLNKNGLSLAEFPWEIKPDALLIRTLPAYHNETIKAHNSCDEDGIKGLTVSSVLIAADGFGVLFTGDTEYPHWESDNSLLEYLKEHVTVLIANMKTLCHEPQDDPFQPTESQPLPLTKNQLGFMGTLKLTELLKPKVLVIRALGLECVITEDDDGNLRYTPDNLAIYQQQMESLLRDRSVQSTVIIPGKHEISVTRELTSRREPFKITERAIVPAYSPFGLAVFGRESRQFVTANIELAKAINGWINRMAHDERPFLVIEGESGGGKTQLAFAMASLLEASSKKIILFDLAITGDQDDLYGKILFGWPPKMFTGVERGHGGLLGNDGILILNQLEKLSSNNAVRFLDVLEEWKYRRWGTEEVPTQPVQAKIIFTTNIPILDCKNLTNDLKNRLLAQCLRLTPLKALKIDEKKRDLTVFVTHWCRENGVVLSSEVFSMIPQLDLSAGSFRSLRGLLEGSKFLAQSAYGLKDSRDNVTYIDATFFVKAMERNQINRVDYMAKEEAISKKMPKSLAAIVALWVSYHCDRSKTYCRLQKYQGRSPKKFNQLLNIFFGYFTSHSSAWIFLEGTAPTRKALQKKDFLSYINSLDVIDENIVITDLLNMSAEDLENQAEALYKLLFSKREEFDSLTVKERFMVTTQAIITS